MKNIIFILFFCVILHIHIYKSIADISECSIKASALSAFGNFNHS